MIRLYNVSKTYAKANAKAVDDLTLEINSGEIFGFLGPNGAGKSTTIKMLTGILTPDSGTIEIDGINIAENPLRAKALIGFVRNAQRHGIFEIYRHDVRCNGRYA